MFDVQVESEDGVCKIKLYPVDPQLEIGGYGREDVLVFKGAPVSILALQKMLEQKFGNVIINNRENSLEIEIQRKDCMLVVDSVTKAVEEMMENAARDLDVIENAIRESVKRHLDRIQGKDGN